VPLGKFRGIAIDVELPRIGGVRRSLGQPEPEHVHRRRGTDWLDVQVPPQA